MKIRFTDTGPDMPLHIKHKDGVYGVFYNSWDRTRHIAFFVPQREPPHRTLCNAGPVNFSESRDSHNLCPECMKLLGQIMEAK